MSDLRLIEAIKVSDHEGAGRLLQSDADINQQDDKGWTPLNWAAGKGDVAMVKLLLENGADVFKVGTDQRTPYLISLAAAHADVARLLKEAEENSGTGKTSSPEKKYCKAYLLSSLRPFAGWSESRINWKAKGTAAGEGSEELTDESIVFIHQDFTVTESMWHNENVIFDQVTPEWREFCTNALTFKVPDDFDLIAAARGASTTATD